MSSFYYPNVSCSQYLNIPFQPERNLVTYYLNICCASVLGNVRLTKPYHLVFPRGEKKSLVKTVFIPSSLGVSLREGNPKNNLKGGVGGSLSHTNLPFLLKRPRPESHPRSILCDTRIMYQYLHIKDSSAEW